MKRFLLVLGLIVTGSSLTPVQAQIRPPVRPAPPMTRPTSTTTASPIRPPTVNRPSTTSTAVRTPATSTATTARRAAASEIAANRSSTPTGRPHANSALSNRSTSVYGLFETKRSTGETRLYKVGISSSEPKLSANRQVSPRAESQVRALNKAHPDSTFRSRLLQQIPPQPPGQPTARTLGLIAEQQAVTRFNVARGLQPTGNQRPAPSPFSPLPRQR